MKGFGNAFVIASAACVVAVVGCSKGTCPYPGTSTVSVDPGQACLGIQLSSCTHPSLAIDNACKDALYLPTEFQIPPTGVAADAGATGAEIEVLPGRSYTFEVREDKARTRTATREDYSVPARIGSQAITITFSITSE